MGYATTILRLRDADRETEISCEGLDGSSEDGAVLELTVVLGYGSSAASRHEGYVRLGVALEKLGVDEDCAIRLSDRSAGVLS